MSHSASVLTDSPVALHYLLGLKWLNGFNVKVKQPLYLFNHFPKVTTI
jgi:hypothetical protein